MESVLTLKLAHAWAPLCKFCVTLLPLLCIARSDSDCISQHIHEHFQQCVLYEKELGVLKCCCHQIWLRIRDRRHLFLFMCLILKRGWPSWVWGVYISLFLSTLYLAIGNPFVHGMSLNCIFQLHNVWNRHCDKPDISNDQLRTSHKCIIDYILYCATKQMQNAFLFKLFLTAFGMWMINGWCLVNIN